MDGTPLFQHQDYAPVDVLSLFLYFSFSGGLCLKNVDGDIFRDVRKNNVKEA